jgi:hypothetical protein
MGPHPPVGRAAAVLAGEDEHSIISILVAVVVVTVAADDVTCLQECLESPGRYFPRSN